MKKIILFSLLFLLSLNITAQDFGVKDFQEEFAYLKRTLPEKHTNLFAKISKADFDRKVDSIAQTSSSIDYDSFVVKLYEILVAIGDEHTFIEADFKRSFPVKLTLFKEGIFVTGIDAAQRLDLPAKLTAINGQFITAVISKFKRIIQSENPSYFSVELLSRLNNPILLHGLGVIQNAESAIYTVETADGKQIDLPLTSKGQPFATPLRQAKAFASLLAHQRKDDYWFTYDAAHQSIYFNYAKCRENPDYPFEKFNDSLFSAIAHYQPKKIIVDLRNNGGGNSAVLKPFIEQIKTSELNKKGRFYVLIGERTFSSALMNAVTLKRYTKATLVGTTTSGTINHYGEVRGFGLPKTKIVIAYSTRYWETWKGKKGPLVPDKTINYSIRHFEAGVDEALIAVYGDKR